MKTILILFLVIVFGVWGYLQFVKDDSAHTNKNNQSAASNIPKDKSATSSGKTINLSNKGLNEIAKDILNNNTVTVLDVSGNNLSGALPAEIRMLTNLEVLDASNNKMTGIPAEVGQLSKLRIVNFAKNNISGLPLEIGNLKNLKVLDLRGNPNVSDHDLNLIRSEIPNAQILSD